MWEILGGGTRIQKKFYFANSHANLNWEKGHNPILKGSIGNKIMLQVEFNYHMALNGYCLKGGCQNQFGS